MHGGAGVGWDGGRVGAFLIQFNAMQAGLRFAGRPFPLGARPANVSSLQYVTVGYVIRVRRQGLVHWKPLRCDREHRNGKDDMGTDSKHPGGTARNG